MNNVFTTQSQAAKKSSAGVTMLEAKIRSCLAKHFGEIKTTNTLTRHYKFLMKRRTATERRALREHLLQQRINKASQTLDTTLWMLCFCPGAAL